MMNVIRAAIVPLLLLLVPGACSSPPSRPVSRQPAAAPVAAPVETIPITLAVKIDAEKSGFQKPGNIFEPGAIERGIAPILAEMQFRNMLKDTQLFREVVASASQADAEITLFCYLENLGSVANFFGMLEGNDGTTIGRFQLTLKPNDQAQNRATLVRALDAHRKPMMFYAK